MDYRRARKVLRDQRHDLSLGVQTLEGLSGVERTTIYRIENLKKYPKYSPDFQTIEKLCGAMGLPLSEFFARLERHDATTSVQRSYPNVGPRPIGGETPAPQEPQGPRVGSDTALPHDDRSLCARLAGACLDALRAAPADEHRRRRLLEDLALAFADAAAPGSENAEIKRTIHEEIDRHRRNG